MWASKRTGRPVKWTAERSESFLTDAHGRDHATKAEMGFDGDGNIVGLRVKTHANMGAYFSTFAPCIPTYLYGTLLQGLYKTPAIHVDVTAAFTNTVPVDAVRGAGRPEATYLLERLLDQAAHETGRDPAELRRQNFIPAFDGVEQPGYETPGRPGLRQRRLRGRSRQGARQRRLRRPAQGSRKKPAPKGGCSASASRPTSRPAASPPSAVVGALGARAGLYESGTVRVQPTGKVSVYTGSHSHGQGHDTTLLAARLRQPRHPDGGRRDRPRRHRAGAVRHGHLRVALAGGRRHGHRQKPRQGQGEGGEDRRPPCSRPPRRTSSTSTPPGR